MNYFCSMVHCTAGGVIAASIAAVVLLPPHQPTAEKKPIIIAVAIMFLSSVSRAMSPPVPAARARGGALSGGQRCGVRVVLLAPPGTTLRHAHLFVGPGPCRINGAMPRDNAPARHVRVKRAAKGLPVRVCAVKVGALVSKTAR